jgi:hypothetical protein
MAWKPGCADRIGGEAALAETYIHYVI